MSFRVARASEQNYAASRLTTSPLTMPPMRPSRAAFEEHSVLVLRDQDVNDEAQLAFSRRFGPPEVTKVGSQGTGTHFVMLTTIGPDGKVVPPDHRMALRSKANQLWHTDSSFKRLPALASILSARTIPEHGGETEFVSTRLAFERLDPDRAAAARSLLRLARLRPFARPDRAGPREPGRARGVARRNAGAWCGAIRPTGAARSTSHPHAYAVDGMADPDGKMLIDELTAAATAPGTSYLHQWRKGDVVMWDNRATMHRGRPWPAPEPRLMVRTTISATEADGLGTMRPPFWQAAE